MAYDPPRHTQVSIGGSRAAVMTVTLVVTRQKSEVLKPSVGEQNAHLSAHNELLTSGMHGGDMRLIAQLAQP